MRPVKMKNMAGVVLVELIVAVVVIGLLTMLAFMNLTGLVTKSQFEVKSAKLINLMEMACESARETGRRYEMVFDPANQYYELREFSQNEEDVLDVDKLIDSGLFDDDFLLSYIQFDDFESTQEDVAIFRIGVAGFQYGGKIVLLDEGGNTYSIVVSRIRCSVELVDGDVELLLPRDKDDMPF